MMASISWLGRSTECFLLVLVFAGLSIPPPAWCQYCNTANGEPRINISSTPPSKKVSIGAAINLTCTAWQTEQLAKNPRTNPYRIEWFDPQDKRITEFQCRTEWPPATLMKCTLEVGALTKEKLGNYTCRARNWYNFCSAKKFHIGRQDEKSSVAPRSEGTEGSSARNKRKNVDIIAITVPLSVVIIFLVGVGVYLQYFRGRCLRNQKPYLNVQHDDITDDSETF